MDSDNKITTMQIITLARLMNISPETMAKSMSEIKENISYMNELTLALARVALNSGQCDRSDIDGITDIMEKVKEHQKKVI